MSSSKMLCWHLQKRIIVLYKFKTSKLRITVSGLLITGSEKQLSYSHVLNSIEKDESLLFVWFLHKGLYFAKEKALLKNSWFPDNISIIQLSMLYVLPFDVTGNNYLILWDVCSSILFILTERIYLHTSLHFSFS